MKGGLTQFIAPLVCHALRLSHQDLRFFDLLFFNGLLSDFIAAIISSSEGFPFTISTNASALILCSSRNFWSAGHG
jgi:hypothetical protein